MVGKYVVDVPSFESLALPAMQPQASSTQLVVIDEVGEAPRSWQHTVLRGGRGGVWQSTRVTR